MTATEHHTHSEPCDAGLEMRRAVLGPEHVERSLAAARDLSRRTGVIGLGNVGAPMAIRLAVCHEVVGLDAAPDAREAAGLGVRVVPSLDDVCATADCGRANRASSPCT